MNPFEKLAAMIAEEFVRQAQNQVTDLILRSGRDEARVKPEYRPKTKAAGANRR